MSTISRLTRTCFRYMCRILFNYLTNIPEPFYSYKNSTHVLRPIIHDCLCLVCEAKANLTHRLRTFGTWSALRG